MDVLAMIGLGMIGFFIGNLLFAKVAMWVGTMVEISQDANRDSKLARLAAASLLSAGPWFLAATAVFAFYVRSQWWATPIFVGGVVAIVFFSLWGAYLSRKARVPDYRAPLYLDYAAGVVVAVLFVGVPIAAYVDHRSLYGEFAELKFFAIGALGTSAAFSLFAGPGRRVLALVPGLIGGLCGAALYLYLVAPAVSVPPEASRGGFLWSIVFLIGTAPGVFLLWLLLKLRGDSIQ